jgi:hypothetical protein
MLLDVPPGVRVRHRVWSDTRDGVVQPHGRREAAVVLLRLRPIGEIGVPPRR